MILAPSRGNVQLFASRVVFAQCIPPHTHRKNNGNVRSFHNNSSSTSSTSNNNSNTLHHRHTFYLPPLVLGGGAFVSTSLFSPLCQNFTFLGILGKRAASGMARKFGLQQKQRLYISSPGQLLNPFLPPVQHPSLLSLKGWSSRYRSIKNILITLISSQQIKNLLKVTKEKFSKRAFRSTASKLFDEINKAIAAGDSAKLRALVTENMYTTISKEFGLKERAAGVGKLHNLSYSANLDNPKVVCVRYTRVSAEKLEDFGQITVYFKGSQTLTVNDISGKVVSTTTTPVSEFWTFERHLQKYGAWKLCAKPTHESVEILGW